MATKINISQSFFLWLSQKTGIFDKRKRFLVKSHFLNMYTIDNGRKLFLFSFLVART